MTEELKIIISAEVSKLKNSIGEAKKVISTFKTEFSKHKKDIVDGWKKIGEGVEKAANVKINTRISMSMNQITLFRTNTYNKLAI